jgi:hypothetical protein
MTKNVGHIDRVVRTVIGIAILSLYFVLPGDQRFFAFIGLIPLVTGQLRWCPLYSLLGFHTCPVSGRQ